MCSLVRTENVQVRSMCVAASAWQKVCFVVRIYVLLLRRSIIILAIVAYADLWLTCTANNYVHTRARASHMFHLMPSQPSPSLSLSLQHVRSRNLFICSRFSRSLQFMSVRANVWTRSTSCLQFLWRTECLVVCSNMFCVKLKWKTVPFAARSQQPNNRKRKTEKWNKQNNRIQLKYTRRSWLLLLFGIVLCVPCAKMGKLFRTVCLWCVWICESVISVSFHLFSTKQFKFQNEKSLWIRWFTSYLIPHRCGERKKIFIFVTKLA